MGLDRGHAVLLDASFQVRSKSGCESGKQAIAIIRNKGRITRHDLAKALGILIRMASRELVDLVTRGDLVHDGQPGYQAEYCISG
ncbi:MAG: DUF977 family protein [Magnetococcus sp. DMHC-1]